MSILAFTIHCPDHETASEIADALLGQHLVACANILNPVESRYHWEGKLQRETEVPLEVKTRPALEREVEAVVKALHPYDVPPIVRHDCRASKAYETWVREVTGG
ncbi:divalent-cation tolerance protein CutA [Actibacterium sp. XHP0104]|uniref:divalent-cation tolerance protein CutA n=1 Tax=Actibacterium sp. XHP0104 TaxID=2984335 RepID=UPI0021E96C89|nr:divalent-cation tolerance protein CutA [Actibacterium sp. XHP0104]MCV2881769.1 divalent-cation tolerance protein CutA [Actibacterium sp. XHP0104]